MSGRNVVALDFGGTLDGTGIPPRVLRWSFYEKAGYRFTKERLTRAHIDVREGILASPERTSWGLAETARQWFTREASLLGLNLNLAQKWAAEFEQRKRSLVASNRSLIEYLHQRYHLAIISNNIGNLELILNELSIRNAFEVIVDSSDCGYRKPDPRIFWECQKRFGDITSACCWYVGDQYENDALGAIGAGWNAAWLTDQLLEGKLSDRIIVVRSLIDFVNHLDNFDCKQRTNA